MAEVIDNFIGVFPYIISQDNCDRIIKHYEFVNSLGKTVSRQVSQLAPSISVENDNYFLTLEEDEVIIPTNISILDIVSKTLWSCYNQYASKYGVLSSMKPHHICYSIKIQKILPSQGYHVWHSEHSTGLDSKRILFAIVYLNDVEEGGETEFLYQSKRVKPSAGTVVIAPAGFTHTHRGNPPLSGVKYIMTTWFEYKE